MDIIIKDLTSRKANRIVDILMSLCKLADSEPIHSKGGRLTGYAVCMDKLDRSKTKNLVFWDSF